MNSTAFDWSDLAFGSKKAVRELRATFIAAPRELSPERCKQLVQTYLPKGNIVLGIAKESFVDGFDGQPQFRTLGRETVEPLARRIQASASPHKLYTISYFQRELPFLLEKLAFSRAVLINGSWRHTFHTLPAYYAMMRAGIPYDMVSPFSSEAAAKTYEQRVMTEIDAAHPVPHGLYSEHAMLQHASTAATFSFDYSHQTGVTLGRPHNRRYEFLAWAYNRVVPYQTYAMHHGASRETHFSPPHDLNHYDTVHAEVELIIQAGRQGIDLRGTTLFINLLPCPSCARMFSETDIAAFVYSVDHSEGYAVKLLQAAGKTVRRVVL